MTTVRPTHLVDRAGVARTSYLVTTRLGWLFREQETSDVGIDAHLEVVVGASLTAKATGGATGRLLAVQVKSGESQFTAATEGGWWFPCDAAHVTYWKNHSLPVALMLFDPETERVHWQHVNADTLVSTGKHYRVFVPVRQQIDDINAAELTSKFRDGPPTESVDRFRVVG